MDNIDMIMRSESRCFGCKHTRQKERIPKEIIIWSINNLT